MILFLIVNLCVNYYFDFSNMDVNNNAWYFTGEIDYKKIPLIQKCKNCNKKQILTVISNCLLVSDIVRTVNIVQATI